ncbi:cell division protein ZapA [Pseudochelatococcus contaminans]|uniref:Cell division protein ZapA n=1 Tax=Pseudochelatococcus contaminans TaxID=1538103 RepID=A0A7W6EFX0_9HYPH|nr:cell division protein ZapA [Pseudochelatococcus contaminans]MBB3809061.1 cell division protein ZapA [Pseudochelatococcus contaminans]
MTDGGDTTGGPAGRESVGQVSVIIAGRPFRMACEAGDEARIEALAARVDARIAELAGFFGSMDDLRLTVMAAFSIADDLAASERRVAVLQAELAAEKAQAKEQEARIANVVIAAAERIEALTAELTPTVQA